MKPTIALFALALSATLAFAACAKSSESSSSTSTTTQAASTEAASAAPAETTAAGGGDGASIYATNCSSCHQTNGQGMTGAFPPLAGNPNVTGDPKMVVHIVKYGLSGKVDVNGKSFNGIMPAWGPQLSDDKIAAVITYVRSSWGNSASAVTTAQVTAVAK